MENLTGVEVTGWYDGIAFRRDENGNKLSRNSYKTLNDNQLCRYGKIYTVEQVGDYDYKIISVDGED